MKAFSIAFICFVVIMYSLANRAESKILDKAELDKLYPTSQSSLLTLNLNGSNYESITVSAFDAFSGAATIFLQNNLITKLITDQFHTNVEYLFLSGNRISVIESGAFKAQNVFVLHLDGNELASFPGTVFSGDNKLHDLILSSNRLTVFPTDAVDAIKQLVVLRLDHNQITELSGEFLGSKTDLKVLSLAGNRITKVNLDVLNNPRLCLGDLNLSGNPIASEIIEDLVMEVIGCIRVTCKNTNKTSGYCTASSAGTSSNRLDVATCIYLLVAFFGLRIIIKN